MNNKSFNSIKEFEEYKESLRLSSETIFKDYLNDIYNSLILREEVINVQRTFLSKKTQEIKPSVNFLLSIRKNTITKKSSQRLKDTGICLKTFLDYVELQEFIAERFFKYLNISKKIKLQKADFINGLNKIYYGDINGLIKFSFYLCDFNDDGKIYRSDMKLLLAYIPSATEYSQKIKIKQINSIINTFFENNISNPEEGTEKEINFEEYSKHILNYEKNLKNTNNTTLLNDYNNNGPFFYFISIISYLFQNCPFDVKNVDYYIYLRKNKKLKLAKNERSASMKNGILTTAKKNEYTINKPDFNSNDLTNVKIEPTTFQKIAIPKIGQKNLFNTKRSISQKDIITDRENEKYRSKITKKNVVKFENKESLILKTKKDINFFKKTSEVNLFKSKLRKSQKLNTIKDNMFNQTKKDISPLNSPFIKDVSHSPQLSYKQNNIYVSDFSSKSLIQANKKMEIKNKNEKVKLPLITKDKWTPVSIGPKKSEDEDTTKEQGNFVLCEYSGSEDDSDNNIIFYENNDDNLNEAYLYKLCEDINGVQSILNKFYGVISNKEILFFGSDLKNELCDLWYINKSYISLGKENYNNQIYFIINIGIYNINHIYKLYFINENKCKNFAKAIKDSIHNLDFNDFYELGEKLGQGHFGTVNKCTNKSTGLTFAVKIINKNELKSDDLDLIHQEKNYLKLIKHPNIICLKDYYEDKQKMYLITECCNGGDLLGFIEKKKKNNLRITEKETAKIIKKIGEGIKYLNFFGIVHRDIKPENILFSQEDEIKTLKIIDLGVCQTLTYGQTTNDPIGTNGYISPEIYLHKDYSFKTDIWSLGIILYLLITEGILPFDNENMDYEVIGKKVLFLQQEYPEEYFSKKSQGLMNLLDKMLEKNPSKRIDINNVVKDEWFKILNQK